MPLKLNVGLSKKIGLPEFGSLGASCHVELELDQSLLTGGGDGFQQKVQQAFVTCRQAVDRELDRHPRKQSAGSPAPAEITNGRPANGQATDQGRPAGGVRLATASQVRALEAITGRRNLDLTGLVQQRFGLGHIAELSIGQASSLIDELKAGANGSGGSR